MKQNFKKFSKTNIKEKQLLYIVIMILSLSSLALVWNSAYITSECNTRIHSITQQHKTPPAFDQEIIIPILNSDKTGSENES